MTDIAALQSEILAQVAAASDEAALEAVRVAALGKKGSVSALLATMGSLSPEERKRNFRALWIQRINAAVREHGLTYSRFIAGLAGAGIVVDRKVLSDLAIHEPAAFKALVDQASKA